MPSLPARFEDGPGRVVLALVLAASIAFLLLSGVEYFGQGRQFTLPIARSLERLLPVR